MNVPQDQTEKIPLAGRLRGFACYAVCIQMTRNRGLVYLEMEIRNISYGSSKQS